VSRSAENAANQARDVTSSSSALLSTIAQIQGNKNDALRSLGQADAASRQQKLLNLQGVNSDMIDEKDKAWNYNVNMPFQNRVAMYRDKMKYGQDLQASGAASSAQSFASMSGGMGKSSGGGAGVTAPPMQTQDYSSNTFLGSNQSMKYGVSRVS
jgi:hypothetical protein